MNKPYNLSNLEPYFKKYLIAENFSLVSLKNYLSDFRHFAGWFDFYLKFKNNQFNNFIEIVKQVKDTTIFKYRNYLIESKLPHKTINRRLSTIRKFCSFCISQGWLKENPAKKITNIKNSHISKNIKEIQDKKASLSPKNNNITSKILEISQLFLKKIKNFKKNNVFFSENVDKEFLHFSNFNNNKNFFIQYYIALLIILIFAASLGASIYKQFFSKTEKLFAYPSTPTRGGRLLSFQGRLTDSLGNPITTGTNVTFKLYNVSTGGSALYTAGPCVITPDQDGIINVLIGGSGYTPTPPSSTYNALCGSEIDPSIFTENPNIYLGITVGSDTEMTPRQQIANVGYAINAETLQGLPPGTTTSTIPFINQDGNLLIAVANPGIRSTYSSSSFTISSANSTVIQSAGLGDVVLQATESGSLKFRTGGDNDSFNRLVIDNNGKVGIGTNTPSQDLEVLGNVYVNTGQLRLGNFTSSPTAIGAGSLYFNTTDSKIYYYTGSLWQEVGSGSGGGESLWQILNGAIFPKNSTVDFLLGGSASSSAKFKVLNINSGIPTASISGSLTNVSLFFDGNGNISTTNRKDLILGNSSSYDSTGNILLNPNGTGNVGIGTTSPSQKLSVVGDIGLSEGNRFIGTTDNYALSLRTNNLDRIYIANDGKIGIGTTSPDSNYLLDVNGAIGGKVFYDNDPVNKTAYGLDPAGTTNFGGYSLKITGGALLAADSGNVGIGTISPSSKLDVAGTVQLRGSTGGTGLYVDSNGNVGIGTTGPTAPLVIKGLSSAGNYSLDIVSLGNEVQELRFGVDSETNDNEFSWIQAVKTGVTFNKPLVLQPNQGRVGIGITNPITFLHVYANQNTAISVDAPENNQSGFSWRKDGTQKWYAYIPANSSDLIFYNTANRVTFKSDGNVGIGTTNPGAYRLYVSGTAYSTGGWQTSDIRLKSKINDINNVLDKINQLETFSFIWKKDEYANKGLPDGIHIGISAQQIQQLFPELINYDNEGYLAVDYSGLTVINTAGIKELNQKINLIKNNISILSSQLKEISLTSTGDLQIKDLGNSKFEIRNSKNELIERIGVFAEAIIAKLKTGLIETQELIVNNILNAKNIVAENLILTTNNIKIAGKTIEQFIDERIESFINLRLLSNNQQILSPIIETKDLIATDTAQLNKIQTNKIQPQNKDLVIDLSKDTSSLEDSSTAQVLEYSQINNENNQNNKGELAKLIIKGLEGKTAVIIDASGNTSFSGQIVAQSLSINNDATISGNLIAENAQINNLQTNQASISGNLTARTIIAENIDSLSQELETTKTDVNEIQRLIAEIKNQNPTNPENYQNLTNEDNITLANLNVTGQTNLYTLSVSNSLLVNSIYIENNSIISLASELKIRALDKIDFFEGGLTIAKDGKLTVKGEIIAQSGIKTNQISLLDNQLTIKNNQGETIANFDSSGSAYFKNLSLEKFTPATPSSVLIAADLNFQENGIFAPALKTASASAGVGLIPQSSQEIIIYNDNIKKDSLIYITPVDNNLNNNFNVSKNYCQENDINCQPYFKVFINQPTTLPLKFNWLIVN